MKTKPIAGYAKELEQLNQLKTLLLERDKYEELGIKTPRGILLFGNPGVGKTVMAKSIISDEINLVELRAADTTGVDANELIVERFKEAKSKVPSILLIDEIDKIAGVSQDFYMESNDNASKILLEEFDAIKPNSGVLIVATCNDILALHPALRRSGRFDREIQIKNPTFKERIEIANLYLDQIKIEKSVDATYIAKTTPNYTGADIETLINESSIQAMATSKVLDKNSLTKALNRMRFMNVESDELTGDEAYKVAIHEAGHALMTALIDPSILGSVSIVPQGNSKGHTSIMDASKHELEQYYFHRRYIPTKQDNVFIAFAGRAAQYIEFKEYFDGAAFDLKTAYELITRDVSFNAIYGTKYYVPSGAMIGRKTKSGKKINKLMLKAEKKTIKILKKNYKALKEIALALVERKTLSREDIFEICQIKTA